MESVTNSTLVGDGVVLKEEAPNGRVGAETAADVTDDRVEDKDDKYFEELEERAQYNGAGEGGESYEVMPRDGESGRGGEGEFEDGGVGGRAEEEDDVDSEFDEDDYDDSVDEESEDDMPQNVPDEEKTPVTVVTGFLGAGKTTLVNYILKEQREMKIAVIENEYGAVSIDTALVEENVREAEDIVTMDNGCVCCTVRGDLVNALVGFLDRRHTFDCILLETTGIADPSPIVATFNQDIDVKLNYRIDSVLCLVDAKNILTQLERKPKEEGTVNEAVQQLAFADSVIVNKTDIVDEKQLQTVKDKIKSVNAFAKVVQSVKSRVPLKSVLNLRSYNLERTLDLLEQEAKEEEARRKAAEEAEKQKEADDAKAANEGKKHACGHGCSHDHGHGHHGHKHEKETNGNGHALQNGHEGSSKGCDDNCSHDHDHGHSHGEKRKRDAEEGDGKDASPAKKPKELVRVAATRHDSQVGSLGLTFQGSFDVDQFNAFMGEFLARHSANLFRSKGVLAFKDQARKFVFQGVHEQINCEPSSAEWAEDGHDRESKIVFIGLELNKDEITQKLTKCIVQA